jgi:PAS domain-containing protein
LKKAERPLGFDWPPRDGSGRDGNVDAAYRNGQSFDLLLETLQGRRPVPDIGRLKVDKPLLDEQARTRAVGNDDGLEAHLLAEREILRGLALIELRQSCAGPLQDLLGEVGPILVRRCRCLRIQTICEGIPSREAVSQRIHPDDRDRLDAEVRRALGEKRRYSIGYRIVLPDGTVKHLESIGEPEFSATGELIEIVATQIDVTERKRS